MCFDKVGVNSFKAWFLAARPKTLSGAAVPVVIGLAFAVSHYGDMVRAVPAALCLLFAFLMQIDANFANDYFDYLKGCDGEGRLGPKRACAQGWITPKAMRTGIVINTLVSCAVGFPLVLFGGWNMVWVGGLCVLFCFLYTTHLSYVGLGDVLVLLFFGVVPVCLTYYLAVPASPCGEIPGDVVWMSVACGAMTDTLLIVNNYRDIENDRRVGKRTLVVMVGKRASRYLYLVLGILACSISVTVLYSRNETPQSFLPLAVLPFLYASYHRIVRIDHGSRLNSVLGETARNILVFGLLVSVSIVFG